MSLYFSGGIPEERCGEWEQVKMLIDHFEFDENPRFERHNRDQEMQLAMLEWELAQLAAIAEEALR